MTEKEISSTTVVYHFTYKTKIHVVNSNEVFYSIYMKFLFRH